MHVYICLYTARAMLATCRGCTTRTLSIQTSLCMSPPQPQIGFPNLLKCICVNVRARSELARMFVLCDIFIRGGGKSELPQVGMQSASRWTLPIAGKLQEPPFKGRPKRNPIRRWADLVSPQASRQRGHPPLPGGDCRAARPSQWSARSRLPNRKRLSEAPPQNKYPTSPAVPR